MIEQKFFTIVVLRTPFQMACENEVEQVYNRFFEDNQSIIIKFDDFMRYCCHYTSSLHPVDQRKRRRRVHDESDGQFFDLFHSLYCEIETYIKECALTILDEFSFDDFFNLCLSGINKKTTALRLQAQERERVVSEIHHHVDYQCDDDDDDCVIKIISDPDRNEVNETTDEVVIRAHELK
jgi:hypothetical protein